MTERYLGGKNGAPLKHILSGNRSGGWQTLYYLAGLLAILVCTFSLTGQFVLDDRLVLVEHPVFRDNLPLWQIFFLDQWGKPISGTVTTYRPIMPLVWWPLWQVFPDNPFIFRLLTLFLHLGATLTVIKVSGLFIKDRALAALGAIFFAVHAVHAEVLGSIAHQNEIVAFILCMWTLYFIARKQNPIIPFLLLILAVLVKESAIIFYPAIILLLISQREAGRRVFLVISILAAAAIMIGVQLSLERAPMLIGNMDNLSYDAVGSERLLHGLHSIGRGLALMIVPMGLAPFHGFAGIDLATETLLPYAVLGGLALLSGSAVLLRGLWKKQPAYVLGASILIGPLLLQSNLIIRTFAELSERWLYTPSLVVCFVYSALLLTLYKWFKKKNLPWLGRACLALSIMVHLFISWKVLPAWKSNDALMAFAVKQEPAAYQSRYFHAKYLLQKEELREGLWYATTAAMIKRQYFESMGRTGKKKFSVLAALDGLPVNERFRLAPAAIAPQRPCVYVRDSVLETARLQPAPPPQILNTLAGLYASQGYGSCFSNPKSLVPGMLLPQGSGMHRAAALRKIFTIIKCCPATG